MNIGFYKYVYTTNSIKRYLNVFVVTPIAHKGHVFALSLVLLVACDESASSNQ